jgi:nucleoside-diphosphate-sugar epimerase
MTKTALILGSSGKIGSHSARAFEKAGWTVKKYDRKAGNMVDAARGVDVIVNGLNPPAYKNWQTLIPAITAQVIEAARSGGATVIVPGNVYNIGPRGGQWSESTPHEPNTKKGRIREEMERTYEQSGVQTIVLRAGNFIDPDGNDDVMSLLFLRSIESGKILSPGDPNILQAYCYVPDWAEAAVLLAEKRAELARFEDIPFPGHSFSVEQLRAFLAQELGRSLSLSKFPWWAVSLTAPFWELGREMLEMRYLWNTPHTLSAEKLTRLLPGFRATDLHEVMRAGLGPIRDSSPPRATFRRSRGPAAQH